jgi:hypothetical protein
MRTSPKEKPRPAITREFMSSRDQARNLATAFEHALPVIRRAVGRLHPRRTTRDHAQFSRRKSS